MAAEGRFYRLSILVDLQDRMQSAMEKVTGTAERFEQRLKNTARAAQMLDRQKIAPVLEGRDRLTTRLKTVASSLRSLTTTAWTVTLRAKDEVSRITNKIGSALSSPLGMLGMGAATVGAGGLMLNSADKAMDFEAQLSSIKALTGATSEEMERLRALSLKLGADTKYSALEAAQGFEELLKAGLSVGQVENGGAEAALNLATAGALDLAEAAEIMSTAMNAYKSDNLSAAQAANILAGTANASATGVSELKFSLAAVSAVASGVGMSFQDVNVALGLFANNGLKGSDAGTSLKTMLMNLIPDTKKAITEFERLGLMTEQGTSAFFNQEGHLKSLSEISELLQKSMAGMTDEERLLSMQTMFGSDAIRAANILYKEGADGVRKFTDEMLKVTALDVAREKMNNAKGAIEQLAGSFETAQIRVMTPFLPLVTRIANGIGDSIDSATDALVSRAEEVAGQIGGFLDELASDEKFQAMDWGDKIVYVLDRMIAAVDTWSSGPGGEQLGKVMTKLAEIGMRSWMAALGGMMKGSLNSLLSGNITGAVGLALGANFLGAGSLIKGGYGLAKGMLGRGTAAGEAAATTTSGGLWSRMKDVWSTGKQLTGIDRAYAGYRTSGIFGGAAEAASPGLLGRASAQGWNLLGGAMRLAKTPLGGFLTKAAVPLGMALDALGVAQSDNKVQAAGGMAGRWAGAFAGGKAGAAGGAALGTLIAPGIGTAAGGILGGIGGSVAGFFAGGKIGEYVGGLASQLDFTPVKNKIVAAKDEMSAAVSAWFDTLPERIGYSVGYSLTWLSELPGRGAAYFGQLVDDADAYVSALPGRLAAWWTQTYSDASTWAAQTVNDTAAWFSSLPGRAETAWQGLYQTVDTWASNTYNSVVNWFSNIPSAIGGYFDQAISNVSAKAGNLWNRMTSGFSAGQSAAMPGHADGGIFSTPHVALFAEEGAEAVIPLNPSRRARALELWMQTGEALGITQYATGGMTGGLMDALVIAQDAIGGMNGTATAAPYGFPPAPQATTGDVTVENVNIINEADEEAMALKIGRMILAAAKQKAENTAS
ncbi:phage tail tape measure protein [Propionispora vibrioides]|uniref:Phage tail tape measure protein, TP901 family, core region n=1 Tax=Propionispora vibrioides TaxID=112903 RepID=A0A1H8U5R4_9FIRM|nr:phage tail tape measure protein [Propionispora vibrioides]SEO98620.1 phage tail tape measure protein, TP901 family, core region [Propionispora vibrioides]